MNLQSKIWLTLGFASAFLAYSLFPFMWKGAWYDLTAFSFVAYTRVIYLNSKGNWSLMAFVINMTTISAFLDEIFFDPTKIDLNEYIATLIIIIITYKFKRKWIR